MTKRSIAFALFSILALSSGPASPLSQSVPSPDPRLSGPVRPCGACRVGGPAEEAIRPTRALPAAPADPRLSGPVRPCGACSLVPIAPITRSPRGPNLPPPTAG